MKKILLVVIAVLILFLVSGIMPPRNKQDILYEKIKIFSDIIETINRLYLEQTSIDSLLMEALRNIFQKLRAYESGPHSQIAALSDSRIAALSDSIAVKEFLFQKIGVVTGFMRLAEQTFRVSPDSLLRWSVCGVTKTLDPHTNYLFRDEFKKFNIPFEGYTGIGIEEKISIADSTFYVTGIIPGSPAEKAGIQLLDRIILIDGLPTRGLSRKDVASKLQGAPGTNVSVTIERMDKNRPFHTFTITRARVIPPTIFTAIINTAGYIRIFAFNSKTPNDVKNALQDFNTKGVSFVILDLRNNPGGYLNSAIGLSDAFIDNGKRILYTKGRFVNLFQEYDASEPTVWKKPLTAIANSESASASEIVLGAIQDHDRGIIIGGEKNTFGKGVAQAQYRFSDGSTLLLTTKRFYTPSGRCPQRNWKKYNTRAAYDSGAGDTVSVAERKTFRTASGRIVYAEEGIRPDIRVPNGIPYQILKRMKYFQNIFSALAIESVRENDKLRKNKPYLLQYRFSKKWLNTAMARIASAVPGIPPDDLRVFKKHIGYFIKLEIARLYWGTETYLSIMERNDPQFQRALQSYPEAEKMLELYKKSH